MDEQAIDQRQDDVTAFLDQIESKMGKPTIDGLVSKLKMKPARFISFLKETVITQFDSNGHGNWSAKKKLNLLYILNKYLQDPVKRKEAHDWTEAFRCILLSVIPEMQDLRDAQHVSKLLKHWTRDSLFPSDVLDEWQRLSDHHLQQLEKNAASASSEQNTAALISQPPRSVVSDEHRKRSSSFVDAQSEVRDQYMSMMRKFLYEAYRHFCRAAVSLNDTLHWRVVITSSFWLLNQYLLQEFYSGPIDVKALESKTLDDPLAVCLSCIYLSGKAEQYFIRSEKLRVVAQKYMSIYFTGVSHPFLALQNPASMEGRSSSGIPSLPGDAALFAMELKLLRLIDYDISEIANPCRTLRDWLLFKRIPPETFQKVTSMFCKEDHLSGHFNYGMDAFDHDNVLAFFMILAETKFPQEDEPSSANVDQSDVLKESIEKVFQSCEVFKELNWTTSLLDMVLTVQSKPLNEIGVQNSARFVKTFLTLWDKYYQEHCERKPALKPVVITPAETSLSSSIVPEATSVQLPLEPPKESVEVVQSSNMSSHIDDHVFPRATLGKRFRSDSNQSNDSRSRGNSQRESHDTRGSYGFGHNDHSSSNSAPDHLRHGDHQQNRSRAPSDQRFQRDDRLHGNAPPSSHSNHPPQRDDHQSRLNAQPDHGFPRGNGQSNPSTLYRGQMDSQSHRNDRPSVYGPQTGNANQPLQRGDHQSQSRNQSDHRFHRDEGLSNRNDVHAGHMGNASHHNDRPNDRPNSYQNNRPNVNGPQTAQGNHYSQRNDDQNRTKPQTDGRFPRDDAHSGHYGRTNDRPNAYGPPVNGGNLHNQRDGLPARSQNDHRFQRDEGHLHQSKQVQSGSMGLTSYGDERQQRPGPSSSHLHHPNQRVDQQTRHRSDSGYGFPPDSNLSNQKPMHQGSVGHNFHRNDRTNAYGPPTASANPPRDDHQSRSRSDSGHQVRHDHIQPRNDSLARPNNAPHDRFNSGQRNTFQSPSQGQFNQNRPPGGFRQSTEVPHRGKIDDFPPGNDRFGRTDRPFEAKDMSPYGPRSQGSAAPALNTHHESTVREPSAYGQQSARFEPGCDRVEDDGSLLRDNQRANPRAGYNHPPFRSDFCVEVKDDRVSPEDNSGPFQSSPPRDFWEHVAREASQPILRVVSRAEGEGEGEGKLHASSPSLNAVTVPSIVKKDTVESVVGENNLPSSGGKAANAFRDPSPPAKYQLNEEPVQLHVTVPAPNSVTCTMKEFQPQAAEAPIDPPFSATHDPTVKLSRESSTTSVGVGKLPGFPRSLLSVAIGSLVRKGPERSYSSVVASASPLRPSEVTKATVSSIEEGEVFEDNRDANDKHRPAVDRGEADEPANKRRKIEEVVVPSKPIPQQYAQQQQQRQSVQQPPHQQQHQQQQRRRFQGQQRNQHHQQQNQQQNQQHHQPQHHQQQNQQHNRNQGPQHNNSHAHGNIAQRNNVPAGRQVFFNANQHHNGRNQQQHHGH